MKKMILTKVKVNSNECFDLKEGDKTIWDVVTYRLGVTTYINLVPVAFEKQMNQLLRYHGIEHIDIMDNIE